MADTRCCEEQRRQQRQRGLDCSAVVMSSRSSGRVWNSCVRIFSTLLIYVTATTAGRQEICNMEVFEARCDSSPGLQSIDSRHRGPQLQQQQQQTHQLILMQSAMYGRMRIGRCASPDYGVIGCGVDVLDVMDWRCSGRRRCRVKVPDDDMYAMTDCPQQVTSYLEASYTCITVAADLPSRCATGTPIQLTEESGYIVSPPISTSHNVASHAPLSIDSSPHGVPRPCTWHIRVTPGQRINLTLYDFGRHFRSSGSSGSHVSLTSGPAVHQSNACIKYAVVTESMIGGAAKSGWVETSGGRAQTAAGGEERTVEGAGPGRSKSVRSAVICGGSGVNDAVRQRFVYSSESNAVDVETFVVNSQKQSANEEWVESGADSSSSSSGGGGSTTGSGRLDSDGVRFLIRYDAVGCADLQLPGNVIVRRDGQLAVTVSCDNSTHSIKHHLVCKDRQWTGDLPSCPNSHQGTKGQTQRTENSGADWWSNMTTDWTYAILTTVGLGVALGVLVGVGLLLATLAYCRRRGRYSGASLRLTDKYCTTIGAPPGGAGVVTPGGDYYERGTMQLMQSPPGGHGPYSVKDVVMAPSGEYTARLLPPGRTNIVDMAARTGSGIGKDDLCLCACSTTTAMTHSGVFLDRQLSQQQRSTAAMFTRELGPPSLHAEYELSA